MVNWIEGLRKFVSHDGFLTFLIAGLYFLGAVTVRWRLIAQPYRRYVRSRAAAVKADLESLPDASEQTATITKLLDSAEQDLNENDRLLWGTGWERAAAQKVMAAERLAADLLPHDDAVAHAIVLTWQLGKLPAGERPAALLLALNEAVQSQGDLSRRQTKRFRALHQQGLTVLLDIYAGRLADRLSYHRKAFWMMFASFLVTVTAAVFFERAALLLFGAVGAVVSRLFLFVRPRGQSLPDELTWGVVILSPYAGALAAYSGLLLLTLLSEVGVLSDQLGAFGWPDRGAGVPPGTLGLAFLFGFSERLLDRLARRAETNIVPTVPSPAPPAQSEGEQPRTSPQANDESEAGQRKEN